MTFARGVDADPLTRIILKAFFLISVLSGGALAILALSNVPRLGIILAPALFCGCFAGYLAHRELLLIQEMRADVEASSDESKRVNLIRALERGIAHGKQIDIRLELLPTGRHPPPNLWSGPRKWAALCLVCLATDSAALRLFGHWFGI